MKYVRLALRLIALGFILWISLYHAVSADYSSDDLNITFGGNDVVEIDGKQYYLSTYYDLTYLVDKFVIDISQDGSFTVTEHIVAYFPEQGHGIYASIPYVYEMPDKKITGIGILFDSACYKSIDGVSNNDEICDNVSTSYDGYSFNLKIGDPNTYIKGLVEYKIKYTVTSAFRRFDKYDEIYWNVIGTESEVSTEDVYVEINNSNINQAECYTGAYGSTENNCDIAKHSNGISIYATDLYAYSGLSVVLAFPLNYFEGTPVEPGYNRISILNDTYTIDPVGKDGKVKVTEEFDVYFHVPVIYYFELNLQDYATSIGVWQLLMPKLTNFTNARITDITNVSDKSFISFNREFDNWEITAYGEPFLFGEYKITLEYEIYVYNEKDFNIATVKAGDTGILSVSTVAVKYERDKEPINVICGTNCTCTKDESSNQYECQGELSQISVKYDSSVIGMPSLGDRMRYLFAVTIGPGLGCLLPIVAFVLAFLMWYFKGRDIKPHGVIPVYRSQKDIDPLIASYIYRMNLRNRDITAALIYLATKGYIKIQKADSLASFELIKTYKDQDLDKLLEHNQLLLKAIFNDKDKVMLSSLKYKFYKNVHKIFKAVEKYTKTNNLFTTMPNAAKLISLLSIFAGGVFMFFSFLLGPLWMCGGMIGSLIFWMFALAMGQRSLKGAELYKHLLGLRLYIDKAEKERIAFHNDPKKALKHFETLLPYAMVFNLENKWARVFKDIYMDPPNWYGGAGDAFTTTSFIRTISRLDRGMKTYAYSRPVSHSSGSSWHSYSGSSGFSSGGGFSGGGFGGGSRGGW